MANAGDRARGQRDPGRDTESRNGSGAAVNKRKIRNLMPKTQLSRCLAVRVRVVPPARLGLWICGKLGAR